MNRIDYKSFKIYNKVYINGSKENGNAQNNPKVIENLVLNCVLANVKLDESLFYDILKKCDDNDINDLISQIKDNLYGEILYDDISNRDYNIEDTIKQYMNYFLRYGWGICKVDTHGNVEEIENEIFKDFLEKSKQKSKNLTALNDDELKDFLETLMLSVANFTQNELLIFEKYFNKIEKIYFNNKNNLSLLIKNKNIDLKPFALKYNYKNLNDLKIMICGILGLDYKNFNSYSKTKFPQYLKTLVMKILNRFDIDETNFEIAKDKDFWNFVQYKIVPSCPRFSKYKKAQKLLSIENIKNSVSINSILTNVKYDSFYDEFEAYYNYNPNFAYKNIISIFTKWAPSELDLSKYKPTNIKSLIMCLYGLLKKVKTESDVSYLYNGKIFVKPKKRNVANLNILVKAIQSLLESQANLIKLDLFKNKKVYLDPSIKNIALPLSPKDTLISETYITKGSKICNIPDTVRVFIAWKRRDNEEGDLDLDAHLSNGKEDICFSDFQDFEYVKYSGDFTNSIKFNPENPIITSEFFDINLNLFDGERLQFWAHSFNSVDFEQYDVYCGVSYNTKLYKSNFINLNDSVIFAKMNSMGKDVLILNIDAVKRQIQFLGVPFTLVGGTTKNLDEVVELLANNFDSYQYFNYYDLMAKMASNVGSLVENKEEADLIISNTKSEDSRVLSLADLDSMAKSILNEPILNIKCAKL